MGKLKLILVLLVGIAVQTYCYIVDPGPVVKATKGEVWPKPQKQNKSDNYFVIQPNNFRFNVVGNDCNTLQDAISRYWKIISNAGNLDRRGRFPEVLRGTYDGIKYNVENDILNLLEVNLTGDCNDTDYPSFDMDEKYELSIWNDSKFLESNTIWGILRGLETFSQLIHLDDDLTTLIVNETEIIDFPRFNHRSLLLDTSRHFIPLYAIFQTLDAMAYNKYNVFHWHITDDHSFPYQSKKFPDLSNRGAYHPISKVYEQTDIARVIEYARERGIRVLPEFDTPGHTRSWGEGVPNILTPCYNGTEKTGKFGPLDVTKNSVYEFLKEFFEEIDEVFPDEYIHLGGDEVEFECWQSNPDITAFMQKENITTYEELESYYIQKLINFVDEQKSKSIVWEEVFVNGVQLPNTTVVHVWKDDDYQTTLSEVTKAGKPTLLSSCWYLDHLSTGGDWLKFYNCEPYNFTGTAEQKKLILGGGACMWSESVNEYNLMSRVWPRASAAAEKLWSAEDVNDVNEAARRLEEHTCRMNTRGIGAQPPNGPGVCL